MELSEYLRCLARVAQVNSRFVNRFADPNNLFRVFYIGPRWQYPQGGIKRSRHMQARQSGRLRSWKAGKPDNHRTTRRCVDVMFSVPLASSQAAARHFLSIFRWRFLCSLDATDPTREGPSTFYNGSSQPIFRRAALFDTRLNRVLTSAVIVYPRQANQQKVST